MAKVQNKESQQQTIPPNVHVPRHQPRYAQTLLQGYCEVNVAVAVTFLLDVLGNVQAHGVRLGEIKQ
jgi:hypothetical protein